MQIARISIFSAKIAVEQSHQISRRTNRSNCRRRIWVLSKCGRWQTDPTPEKATICKYFISIWQNDIYRAHSSRRGFQSIFRVMEKRMKNNSISFHISYSACNDCGMWFCIIFCWVRWKPFRKTNEIKLLKGFAWKLSKNLSAISLISQLGIESIMLTQVRSIPIQTHTKTSFHLMQSFIVSLKRLISSRLCSGEIHSHTLTSSSVFVYDKSSFSNSLELTLMCMRNEFNSSQYFLD